MWDPGGAPLAGTALVRRAKASEPLPVSLRAKDDTVFWAKRGSHLDWSSDDPHLRMALMVRVL